MLKLFFIPVFLFALNASAQTFTAPSKPYSKKISYQLAVALCDSGKYQESSAMLEDLLSQNPHNDDYWFKLSYCQGKLGKKIPALNCLKKVESIIEYYGESLLNWLGYRYAETGNTELAKKFYYRALSFDPHYVYSLSNLLFLYAEEKDLTDGRKIFSRLLSSDSDHFFAYQKMGYLFESIGTFDSALFYYQKCLGIDSSSSNALVHVGFDYAKQNNLSLGTRFINQAIQKAPSDSTLPYWLAACYFSQDSFARAIGILRAVEPKLTNDQISLALICRELSENYYKLHNLDSALYYAKKAFQTDPGNVENNTKLLVAYHDRKDYNSTLDLCRIMLTKFPDQDVNVYSEIVVVYIAEHKYDQAIDYALKTLKIDPENFKTLINLGYIYWKKHNNKANVEYTRAALKISPNDILAHANYGEGLFLIGKKDEALEEYEILKKLGAKKEADYLSDLITGKKKSYDLKD